MLASMWSNWSSLIQYWRECKLVKPLWNHSLCIKEPMNHQSFIKTQQKYEQIWPENVHRMFMAALLILLNWKQLIRTSQVEWKKEIWVYSYNRILYCYMYTAVYTHTTWENFTTNWEKKQTSTRKKNIKWFYLYKAQNQVKLTYDVTDQNRVPTDDDGVKTGG